MPHSNGSVRTTTVSTLIEVQGGPDAWAEADKEFAKLDWPLRDTTPRERRIARRAYGAGDGSCFRWADVPVPGSPWRAAKCASWMIADAGRRAKVIIYARTTRRQTADPLMQPAWQVYSTKYQRPAHPPATVPRLKRPWWRVRSRLYRAAVRLGAFDIPGERVTGSRESALRAARELYPGGTRIDVDVRPLDGLGRPGMRLLGERAYETTGIVFTGLVVTSGFLLVLAREAPSLGKVLFGGLAIASLVVGWWKALALPIGRGRRDTILITSIVTPLLLALFLGLPGLSEGWARKDVVALAAAVYYLSGLFLLVQRWRWQGLLVGVMPLLITVVIAALPVTSRVLHDMYADTLLLTTTETTVSTTWRLAATVRLLWPTLLAVLGVGAGWGLLRHLHYIRPGSVLGLIILALAMVVATVVASTYTVDSPRDAATALQRAASDRTPAPPYFGVRTAWSCAIPTVPLQELREKGGQLDPLRPYLSFGIADSHVVLWNAPTGAPLRIPAEQIRLVPANDTERTAGKCT